MYYLHPFDVQCFILNTKDILEVLTLKVMKDFLLYLITFKVYRVLYI